MDQLIDPLGRVTDYTYDEAGRLTELLLPDPNDGSDNVPITYEYDTVSNLRFVTDQLGRETEFQFDDRSRLERLIDPDPDLTDGDTIRHEIVYTYFEDNQLESITETTASSGGNPVTRQTTYEYDAIGRLATVELPQVYDAENAQNDIPEWQYKYDEFHNVSQVTDPRGNTTTFGYDNLHRLVSVIGADPNDGITAAPETTYGYDKASQLVSVTEEIDDSNSRTTSYLYDDLGRLIRTVLPNPTDGSGYTAGPDPTGGTPFTRYEYDEVGNLTAMLEPDVYTTSWAFAVMSYTYDGLNRRLTETDANGDTTTFAYDAASNLVALTDPATTAHPDGNTTSWTYDALDRVVTETDPLENTRDFQYDLIGNLTRRIDREGRVIDYAYDDMDRLTDEFWYADIADASGGTGNADRQITFGYDLASRMTSSSDVDHDYAYEYDDLDRVTLEEQEITGLTPHVFFTSGYNLAGGREDLAAEIGTDAPKMGTGVVFLTRMPCCGSL